MSPSAWSFSVYWHAASLRRDLDVLWRCGWITDTADRAGHTGPGGWWDHASRAYLTPDAEGVLAHRTCLLVAARFASEVAS